MELITFIIVTWNNQQQIRQCLQTIMKYTLIPHHIIVVDNQSSDETVQIIQKEFPAVNLIISPDNVGFAKANNLALWQVNSEYVCFINPDIILTEDIINPSIQVLKKKRDVGLVACKLRNLDSSLQPSCFHFADAYSLVGEILHIGKIFPQFLCKKYFTNFYNAKENFYPQWVIGAEMVMRTQEAKDIGGFSTECYMYTEDMDLCKKIGHFLKKKIYYLANISLIHLGGASEVQNFNYNKQEKLIKNDMFFFKKFYGENEVHKALKNMNRAYNLRLKLLQYFYYKKDKALQLDKTKKVIEIIKEIRDDYCSR